VLVCHALTGDHQPGDAGRKRGWWRDLVGPGRAIDTEHSFVLATNVIGSCYGSTGPDSNGLLPDGRPFPEISVQDMGGAQQRLLEVLGIERLRLVIGGSLGGLQALTWAGQDALPVDQVIAIGAADRLPALQLALCHAQHVALELGLGHGDAEGGLKAARAVAMATYRSNPHFEVRFGRSPAPSGSRRFAVESYLDHHGDRLAERFSAWSYLLLSRAMANFAWDLRVQEGTRVDLVSIRHDWLFPEPAVESLHARLRLKGVAGTIARLDTEMGHDAFLAEQQALSAILRPLLQDAQAAPPEDGTAELNQPGRAALR
jgi:homoserine O-acetyltransferase